MPAFTNVLLFYLFLLSDFFMSVQFCQFFLHGFSNVIQFCLFLFSHVITDAIAQIGPDISPLLSAVCHFSAV
jgi:hypothetical protein